MLIIGEKKESIEITMPFYSKIEDIAVSLKRNKLLIKWKKLFEKRITHTRSLVFQSYRQSSLQWELFNGVLIIFFSKIKALSVNEPSSSIISIAK